jgi:hypothetical protein
MRGLTVKSAPHRPPFQEEVNLSTYANPPPALKSDGRHNQIETFYASRAQPTTVCGF